VTAPEPTSEPWRRFTLALAAAAAALLLAVGAVNALTDPWGVFGVGLIPPRVNQDRAVKGDLLGALAQPPELLVFGSSRAWQIEADRVARATGRRAFNAAVTAGRPADAYVFASFVHDTWSTAHPDYLWLLDVEAFERGPLPPSLLADARFSRYLPWRARAAAQLDELGWVLSWRGLEESWRVWRKHPTWEKVRARWRKRVAPDGTVKAPPASEARVTAKRLRSWRTDAKAQYRAFARLDPEAVRYLGKTLALFSSWAGRGVVVLTPTHPDVLAAARTAGWDERHDEVAALLRRLQRRYGFAVVDLTNADSFGATPTGFYDATHMTRANQRRMIAAVLAAHGAELRER